MSSCPACDGDRASPSYLGRGRYAGREFDYLACHDCGSLFVDPMPDEAMLDAMYAPGYLDQHYAAELAGESRSAELGREIHDTAAELGALKPGGRVLDVGCGAGRFLVAARAAGLRVEGLERLPATARVTEAATGVRVHSGELGALAAYIYGEAAQGYDVVHFADVLEHAPRPLDLLEAARRLLAPGGVVLARGPLQNHTTLFQQGLRFQRLARARLRPLPPTETAPTHVILFTLEGWHALIRRAGLHVRSEHVYELHWPAPERPALRPVSLLKEVSLRLSRSLVGRRLRLGDRVSSVLEPAR